MKNYYFCFDVGGTSIKGGIIDEQNKLLCSKIIPTNASLEHNYLVERIIELIIELEKESKLNITKSKGIGIGLPGLVDKKGTLVFSGNLKLSNFNLKKELTKVYNLPIKIANDAELATLAEKKLGFGKKYNNFIFLTLGTGIGGGIVINNQLLRTNLPFSSEIGHMQIPAYNKQCSCGNFNCFETYASTIALKNQTKISMQNNPKSLMWNTYNLDTVNGKTVFEYNRIDKTAKDVFNTYISNLGNGIISLYNIFCPEAVIIGGSISKQKENLTKPLNDYVSKYIFTKNANIKSNIISAKLEGNAGMIGAKLLFDKEM